MDRCHGTDRWGVDMTLKLHLFSVVAKLGAIHVLNMLVINVELARRDQMDGRIGCVGQLFSLGFKMDFSLISLIFSVCLLTIRSVKVNEISGNHLKVLLDNLGPIHGLFKRR